MERYTETNVYLSLQKLRISSIDRENVFHFPVTKEEGGYDRKILTT